MQTVVAPKISAKESRRIERKRELVAEEPKIRRAAELVAAFVLDEENLDETEDVALIFPVDSEPFIAPTSRVENWNDALSLGVGDSGENALNNWIALGDLPDEVVDAFADDDWGAPYRNGDEIWKEDVELYRERALDGRQTAVEWYVYPETLWNDEPSEAIERIAEAVRAWRYYRDPVSYRWLDPWYLDDSDL